MLRPVGEMPHDDARQALGPLQPDEVMLRRRLRQDQPAATWGTSVSRFSRPGASIGAETMQSLPPRRCW